MHFVYILHSKKLNRYYVGETIDLKKRLERHNSGRSKYTKAGIPWELIKFIEVENRSDGKMLEKKIKNIGAVRFLKDRL